MKFFTAFLATETNTFVSVPTGRGSFEEYGIYHGDASTRAARGYGVFPLRLREMLAAEGHQMVESLLAFAQPLGRTVRSVYEELRDEILDDLRRAGKIDGVILALHGAMVADGYDDCEGDLISRVRAIVGPEVPIGVELDLHCHYTRLMHESSDVIVAYKEYPHTDSMARMMELARIVIDAAEGRVKPVMAVHDCRMVGLWHTTREPMAGFVRRMIEAEKIPGVLSVSLGHGFPWGDVPEAGAKLWVVTDNNPALAATVAQQLGKEFWTLREEIGAPVMVLEQALAEASRVQGGPVTLADVADNAGGGATSDNTYILRNLIDKGIGNVAIGAFWDLGAVQLCSDAGVGATFELRLGGKCGPASGDPVDLTVTVMGVRHDYTQSGLESEGGVRTPLGTSAWVRAANGVDIVIISRRSQTFSPDLFTGLGIELASKQLIVVKSAQHFHAAFAPISKKVLYVSIPGAKSYDFANLPYRARDLNYWPRLETPDFTEGGPAMTHTPPARAAGEFHTIDGIRLHLQRSGPMAGATGLPTVVIEAGAGTGQALYGRLQHELARKYRVVSYDRPGLGWSERDGAGPIDAVRNARRLHALLEAAGITGPIVLVGHSLGGMLSRVYAGLYPDQVAGVMMLDSSHPDQSWELVASTQTLLEAERQKRIQFQTQGTTPAELAMIQAMFGDLPQVIEQMVATYRPEVIDAVLDELRGLGNVARQAAASPGLGDRPLAVLWVATPVPAGAPDALRETQEKWPGFQKDLAALSSRSHIEQIPEATHMSIVVMPQFVARIVSVLDAMLDRSVAAA